MLGSKKTDGLASKDDQKKIEQRKENKTVNLIFAVVVLVLVVSGIFAFNHFNNMFHFI